MKEHPAELNKGIATKQDSRQKHITQIASDAMFTDGPMKKETTKQRRVFH